MGLHYNGGCCTMKKNTLLRIRNINMEYLPKELRAAYENDVKCCKDLDIDKDLINVSDILKAYYILADYFTDPSIDQVSEKMMVGVRSYNLLSSAVGRQCVEFAGKRTGLLILLYQLQLYGYYPKQNFSDFEKLVVSVADNSLERNYSNVWKKFRKQDDCVILTISYIVRRLVVKKNNSYHLSITTKEFCNILEQAGVEWELEGQKIRLRRTIKKFIGTNKYTYTINFYGWTRPVKVKMARDTCDALHLTEEYPNFEKFSNGEGNIYKTICDFEMPLRRLKDE